ncbi:tripartite tricarboxylate transporter TctB family protein [Phaeobacter sp. HF9A]|uniref:tripartite tricarboxylate transporter TctB family protein n=1 Tax=Phaeobacter sp. HF9A TaxID=2721561 RepID=UPI00142F6515|nr:tripartite tricarboxylate transporter TctB family protein [Phaeobacter sp. HF9A]NIZ13157.1 tripartite tricarboxylate transporter TctB family protein [Phaeobacter sp. HF9A]
MSEPTQDQPHIFPEGRKPGEMLFSMLLLILAAALLAALPWQTTWISGKGLAAQPRFWPALSLGGVILFAILHKLMRHRVDRTPGRWSEGLNWIRSLEYIGWYMLYVATIPVIGYLFATVIFCTLLSLRVGYRGRMNVWAALFGLVVVLFFKSAMNVKIPGGAIYDYAPDGLRYILLRYF